MKTTKNYYPLIAGAVIALGGILPVTLAGEKNPPVQQKSEVTKAAVVDDELTSAIKAQVIAPLQAQSKRSNRFSRKGPVSKTDYNLVETTQAVSGEERTFTVVRLITSIYQPEKEPTSSNLFKLRSLKKSGELQVALGEKWVALDEHPILKRLLKTKEDKTITP